MKRPDWCPHNDCIFQIQSQNSMCKGQLPKPEQHDNDFNTHCLCIDTRETGHGIFDLQVNAGDCWNLIRLLNTVFRFKSEQQIQMPSDEEMKVYLISQYKPVILEGTDVNEYFRECAFECMKWCREWMKLQLEK